MPFTIVRNDITNMQVDAIVNTANPQPMVGAGADAAIHEKAGPQLLKARRRIGHIDMGCAVITPAYRLDAKYVIHTVGPVWNGGGYGEESLLRNCYENALQLALEHHCETIAFPLISTGHYGFPKDKALQIAISAFTAFLSEYDLQIYLVVFDHASFRLSENLFCHVESYIDENYVNTAPVFLNASVSQRPRRNLKRIQPMAMEELSPGLLMEKKALSLEDMLKQTDAGFTETLLKLIDKTGKKDAEIYKKANISKQHFSKIRNNPDYKPTKPTAVALALALELNLEETRDLIGRAGYALTNSSKFDLIIRYFIENRNYNIVEINVVLFEHDQMLLST